MPEPIIVKEPGFVLPEIFLVVVSNVSATFQIKGSHLVGSTTKKYNKKMIFQTSQFMALILYDRRRIK